MTKKSIPPTPPAKVVAFTNAKGGVGKTTTTGNVGMEVARRGNRTLMIDLDPQADLSASFGVTTRTKTVGHVLLGQDKLRDCIQQVSFTTDDDELELVDKLFLLPSSVVLGQHEPQIAELQDYEQRLATVLREVATEYDYIVLDCPPALSTMTYMAFCAADAYVVPSSAEQLSYTKIALVKKAADSIAAGDNPRLLFAGIVFTRYNSKVKRKLNEAILIAATANYGKAKILPSIRQDVNLAEAQACGIPALFHSPSANGVEDYSKLTTAILKRI